MTKTIPTLAHTGLASLVLFGALTLATTATAEAKQAPTSSHRGLMKHDQNGDGKISPWEKQAAITATVQRIMLKADKNGDGKLGPFEIRTAPGHLSAWLGNADLNKNGFVTKFELRALIAKRWQNGVPEPWGKPGGRYNGKPHPGNGAPAKPSGWIAPKPMPPVINVRDHRQPAPKPPAVNVRDHRQPNPSPAPSRELRPSVRVPAVKGFSK